MQEIFSPERICRLRAINRYRSLLRSWYGDDERAVLESDKSEPGTVRIGTVIESICAELDNGESAAFITICSKWDDIVGTMSKFICPGGLKDGVLALEVRHSALIREITPSLDLFKRRISAYIGENVCREIKLVPYSADRAKKL